MNPDILFLAQYSSIYMVSEYHMMLNVLERRLHQVGYITPFSIWTCNRCHSQLNTWSIDRQTTIIPIHVDRTYEHAAVIFWGENLKHFRKPLEVTTLYCTKMKCSLLLAAWAAKMPAIHLTSYQFIKINWLIIGTHPSAQNKGLLRVNKFHSVDLCLTITLVWPV